MNFLLYTFSLSVALCGAQLTTCLKANAQELANTSSNNKTSSESSFEHFVTRKGHQLFDGDREFRFLGLHLTELHRIEDDVKATVSEVSKKIGKSDHFKLPTAQEQENWIKSLVRTGHTATRIYALSIEDIKLDQEVRDRMPAHIVYDETTKSWTWNEEAMVVLDRAIALSDQHQLRLIIPIIDHWSWWGGKRELTQMVGEEELESQAKGRIYDVNSKTYDAYQQIIKGLLTRKNTVTGREYRHEKAIMAWETGNELRGTTKEFLAQTAALFKELAPNHLVIDGDQAADYINPAGQAPPIETEFLGLTDPNVDIQSNHLYSDYMTADNIKLQGNLALKYEKPLFIGEYGLQPIAAMTEVTNAIKDHPAIAGALIWGFRGHRQQGGFYWHNEGTGNKSYHLPGFPDNDENEELAVINLMRQVQSQMSKDPKAVRFSRRLIAPQDAPMLRPVGPNRHINWIGSPLGQTYDIYRASDLNGPWKRVAEGISDGRNGYDPATMNLYSDTEQLAAGTWHYKVKAKNAAGESGFSNIQSVKVMAVSKKD